MTEEEKSLIEYRMARAREALEEARLLFDAGHINVYVNRLYYACFYAVSALLFAQGMSCRKHGQARALFHREFVKTRMFPLPLGKHFDLLFDSRQEGDYGDFTEFKAQEVAVWMERTGAFVDHAQKVVLELIQE